jgi:type IV secretion system protein VirB10
MRSLFVFLTATGLTLAAQTPNPDGSQSRQNQASGAREITVPAGTQVLLQLKSPIDTKSARVGDGVYCQSTFPVTIDDVVVIPAGTYVKGRITRVQRPGRVKGRAEILFNFNSMIFPNGHTVDLPGALQNEPGATNSKVADEEGTVRANGQKGKDAGTVASTAGTGAAIGAISGGGVRGAGIGAGVGGVVGLATVLLTRGQDVRIDQGTSLEMVLQRPLTVDIMPGESAAKPTPEVVPRPSNKTRLPVPKADANPK